MLQRLGSVHSVVCEVGRANTRDHRDHRENAHVLAQCARCARWSWIGWTLSSWDFSATRPDVIGC